MNEFEKQAEEFLKEAGAEMNIEFHCVVDGLPFDMNDHLQHNKYTVTLRRGTKEYIFPFYDSYVNYKDGTEPTKYDVLSCVMKSDPGTMGDFIEEYGFRITGRKTFNEVEGLWKACKKEYESLLELFGPELMEKLAEIN